MTMTPPAAAPATPPKTPGGAPSIAPGKGQSAAGGDLFAAIFSDVGDANTVESTAPKPPNIDVVDGQSTVAGDNAALLQNTAKPNPAVTLTADGPVSDGDVAPLNTQATAAPQPMLATPHHSLAKSEASSTPSRGDVAPASAAVTLGQQANQVSTGGIQTPTAPVAPPTRSDAASQPLATPTGVAPAVGMASDPALSAQASQTATAPSASAQTAKVLETAIKGGAERVRFVLNPPDLGRVEIQIVRRGGEVQAHIRVERSEALDALRTEFRGLERAFTEITGRAPAPGDLQTSLGADAFSRNARGQHGQERGGAGPPRTDTADPSTDEQGANDHAGAHSDGSLDVRI